MMDPCKWAMYTIPHSGTRYIADSFKLGGNDMAQCSPRGPEKISMVPNGLMWAHWGIYHKNAPKFDTVNVDRSFAVVRCPALTWATHARNVTYKRFEASEARTLRFAADKKPHLLQHYDAQELYSDKVSYWHRVDKDSLESLADWTGTTLSAEAPSHSRPTDIKQAVLDRDQDRIRELVAPTDFWDWFVEDLTPRIAPRYEALGYDLWWKNG